MERVLRTQALIRPVSFLGAEALRVARQASNVHRDVSVLDLTKQISDRAMARSLSTPAPDLNRASNELPRADGESKFRVHGAERVSAVLSTPYTGPAIDEYDAKLARRAARLGDFCNVIG